MANMNINIMQHDKNRGGMLLTSSKLSIYEQVSTCIRIMALFHCMVRHGTVRYGSLLGGFPLGTVPGT